jgi:hypothetical protein
LPYYSMRYFSLRPTNNFIVSDGVGNFRKPGLTCLTLGSEAPDLGTLNLQFTPKPILLGLECDAGGAANDFNLGIHDLHLTISSDRDLVLWDYDPHRLLDDAGLNPDFVEAAHQALGATVRLGLRPEVHEAYRSPEESDRKHKLWKQGKGGRAAAAWKSCHNYGLAMDVWLYDRKKRYIDNHVKGWYRLYKLMAGAAIAAGFIWGEGFGDGDSDHFEFHPSWKKGANGSFLLKVKAWALQAAPPPGGGLLPNNEIGPVPEPSQDVWMPYFWWAAGAGQDTPETSFMATHAPPIQ